MKKILFLITSLLFAFFVNAQVSKTVNISAGGLSTTLTTAEFTSVTNLTITGSIDARDFKCMRDGITKLAVLDISAAKIEAYSGNGGTSTSTTSYLANEIPEFSFTNSSYNGKASLESVILPISNKSISNNAFYGCTGLKSISISDSVSSIGEYAFYECSALTIINFPDSLTSIKKYAFKGCTALASLTIPCSVSSIEESAFWCCSGLTSVIIGDTITTTGNTSIGSYAFSGCYSLTNVIIGNSVTSIGSSAFYICNRLSSVTIGNSVRSIKDHAFYNCTSLTSIIIPNSVRLIEHCVFYDCTGLKSVIIGNSVTSIGNSAFYNCTELSSLRVNTITPCSLGSGVFTSVNVYACILYIPAGSKTVYQAASGWGDFINIIEMPITSLTNQIKNVVNIYPNPVTDGFYIDGLDAVSSLTLTDLGGKTVLTKHVIANEYVTVNFLPKGVYLARITTPNGLIEKKIIKN